MPRGRRGLVLIAVLFLAAACGTSAAPSTAEEIRQAFPFIADGVTTKAVLARRGFSTPDDSFEGADDHDIFGPSEKGRILVAYGRESGVIGLFNEFDELPPDGRSTTRPLVLAGKK